MDTIIAPSKQSIPTLANQRQAAAAGGVLHFTRKRYRIDPKNETTLKNLKSLGVQPLRMRESHFLDVFVITGKALAPIFWSIRSVSSLVVIDLLNSYGAQQIGALVQQNNHAAPTKTLAAP